MPLVDYRTRILYYYTEDLVSIHYGDKSWVQGKGGNSRPLEERPFLHQICLEYEEGQKYTVSELAIDVSRKEKIVYIHEARSSQSWTFRTLPWQTNLFGCRPLPTHDITRWPTYLKDSSIAISRDMSLISRIKNASLSHRSEWYQPILVL